MNQDQIDASAEVESILANKEGKQLINLYAPVSPAVLAGLFGISVANIYQYRQNGKLPPNSDASYRDCIRHYTTYLKDRAGGKVASLREAAELQKIQLDRVRTEKLLQEVKLERMELIDKGELAELLEPLFIQTKSQFASLIRKHPEMEKEINNILITWNKIGEAMRSQAERELEDFVETQMDYEPELENEEEDSGPIATVGDNERNDY